jgi:hypothetical protein
VTLSTDETIAYEAPSILVLTPLRGHLQTTMSGGTGGGGTGDCDDCDDCSC